MLTKLLRNLVINEVCCLTDSPVSHYWIMGESSIWKQFVQNVVDEVRSCVKPKQLRFCPGAVNPADLPSRGVKASVLSTDAK